MDQKTNSSRNSVSRASERPKQLASMNMINIYDNIPLQQPSKIQHQTEEIRYQQEKRRVENGLKQLLDMEYDDNQAGYPLAQTAKSDQIKMINIGSQSTSRSFLHFKPPLSTKGGKNQKFFFSNNNNNNTVNTHSSALNGSVCESKEKSSGNLQQNVNLSFRYEKKHIRQSSVGAMSDLNTTNMSNHNSSFRLMKKQSFSQLETIDQIKQKKSTDYIYHKMGLNTQHVQEKIQSKINQFQPSLTNLNSKPFFNSKNQNMNDYHYDQFLNYQDSEENSLCQTNNKLNIANYDLRSACTDNDCEDDGKQLSLNFTLSDAKSQFIVLSQNKKQHQMLQDQIFSMQSQFAIRIQKNFKRFMQEKKFKKIKEATLVIQKHFKRIMKIKEKKIKDHLFVLSGQQKRVLKELEKLNSVESQLNIIYQKNKRVQKFIKKNQSKVFEQFSAYIQKEVQTTSSLTQTEIIVPNLQNKINEINSSLSSLKSYSVPKQLIQSLSSKITELLENTSNQISYSSSQSMFEKPQLKQLKENIQLFDISSIRKSDQNEQKISSSTLHASKTSNHLTPFNSASNEGYLTTQESENYTERINENCRCSAQKIIQRLRDELKHKVEYDSLKETTTYKELLFIQDELHKSNIQHKSLMVQISEALKKFEIKIITDLTSSNQENFELIKDLQQINTFIQDQIMFCSPQTVKRRQFFGVGSSNDSSSGMSKTTLPLHKPLESRKLVFDSAGSYCTN